MSISLIVKTAQISVARTSRSERREKNCYLKFNRNPSITRQKIFYQNFK